MEHGVTAAWDVRSITARSMDSDGVLANSAPSRRTTPPSRTAALSAVSAAARMSGRWICICASMTAGENRKMPAFQA